MKVKFCKGCQQEKKINRFHKNKKSSDGRQWFCKECVKKRQREHYVKFSQKILNRNKRWSHANPEAKREINKQWRHENKERLLELDRSWRKRNKHKVLEIHRRYRANNQDRYLGYKLKREFKISIDDYKKILNIQNNLCAGCLTSPKKDKRLCIDHDHKTGLVRGLLCHGCNMAIGHGKDNPNLLRRLADYLEQKGVDWKKENNDTVKIES